MSECAVNFSGFHSISHPAAWAAGRRGRNKAPAMVERPMPPSAPASLGRPHRPESFIPGPATWENAPRPRVYVPACVVNFEIIYEEAG